MALDIRIAADFAQRHASNAAGNPSKTAVLTGEQPRSSLDRADVSLEDRKDTKGTASQGVDGLKTRKWHCVFGFDDAAS